MRWIGERIQIVEDILNSQEILKSKKI